MRKRKLAALILAVPVLFSCSETDLEEGGTGHGQIVASIDNAEVTSVAFGHDAGGTTAAEIVWTDGDEIGVFDESGISPKRYGKLSQGNQATATFAASGTTASPNPLYACYPYDDANATSDISSLTGTLTATRLMDGNKLNGDYRYGHVTRTTADGDYEFVFNHLFPLACITVDASGTPLADETLKSLTVSVSRGETNVSIAGDFTFSAEDGHWAPTGGETHSVTLVWSQNAPALSQPQTCYMSLFPLVEPATSSPLPCSPTITRPSLLPTA